MAVEVTSPAVNALGEVPRRRAVTAVAALSAAMFAFATVESLPVGLLPQIAHGLGVPLSSVGLLVTGYGLVVMTTAVPLTAATRRVPRRRLLGLLLGLFAAATLLCGVAPGYGVLFAGRVLTALTHAVIWSVVASAAAGMFPERARAKAVAALFSGASLAQVAGVPVGTWLGQQVGWRVPFLVLGGAGMLAATVVVVLLPSTPVQENPAATAPEPSRFRFVVLVTVVALVVAGFFTFYTYVSVFLTRVAGLPSGSVGAVLAVGGVAGLLGTSVAGVLSDRSPRAAMTGAVGLMTAALALLATAGTRAYVTIAAVALLSLAMSIMIIALTSRVLRIAPGHVDVSSAAGSAAFQAGIALGSLLGGGLLEAHGPHSTVVIGAFLCAGGLALLLAEEPLSRSHSRSRPRGAHA